MKRRWIYTMSVMLFMLLSLKGYPQNLLRNGDFEYPTTDELSLKVNSSSEMIGWEIQSPVVVVNHTRLFPYSNFQCLLLPVIGGQKASIVQHFNIPQDGKVKISFAFAASRLENGKLIVRLDGKEIATRAYTDYWVSGDTRLTDHMKWEQVILPEQQIPGGKHSLEILEDSCQVVRDHQGDQRDMIEGFLIDKVEVEKCPDIHYSGVPSLDELAGQKVETKTLACYPAIGNFLGSVRASKQLGAFETQFLYGSKLTRPAGTISVNESVVFSQQSKWYPYQVVNFSKVNGIALTATMRLVFEKKGVLMQIEMENRTTQFAQLPLSMELVKGMLQNTKALTIDALIDYASNSYGYSFNYKPDTIKNKEGNNYALWNVTLNPGEKKTLSYVLSIHQDASLAISNAREWNRCFSQTFSEAMSLWERRWMDVFTPHNNSYSGYLPTFETTDKNLYQLYYLSIVSFLQTQQNHVYPTMDIAFGSNNEWAINQAYFWEISQFADMYALLDPKGLKAFIKMALNVNLDSGNAIDYHTGKIVNHWYAVNDYALFKTIDSYLRINRDFDFLNTSINGKTVFEHLKYTATNWEKRFNKQVGLADYGNNPWSFFETNPDYIHCVPAMNAQNVWMLRSMAEYDRLYAKGKDAPGFIAKADQLAKAVKSLYVPGEGVWKVRYPNGDSIVSRHSYDFLTIGMTMHEDLTAQVKKEMIHFVDSELMTPTHFMRAMSLKDQAAFNSDRSDHGPVGCYIGWPAMTAQAMADMGEFEKAKNTLSDFRNAFVESGMGQAVEFLVPVGSATAVDRIGARAGASFLLSGSDYANAIIDGLMGYKPSINGRLTPYMMNTNRHFEGKMSNIRYGENNYSFQTTSNGIEMQELK